MTFIGKHHTAEERQRRARTQEGIAHPDARKPDNSLSRRPTGRVEYRAWRLAVIARDGYLCRDCGAGPLSGRNLIAHHIIGWDEGTDLRYVVANGLTLCKRCHNRHHLPLSPSPEAVEKVAAFHRGRKRSEETRQRIGDAKRGKHHSDETRRKMSESHRRRWLLNQPSGGRNTAQLA